jgi:hypothetical protein
VNKKKIKLMASGKIDEFELSKTQTCMHKENVKTRN